MSSLSSVEHLMRMHRPAKWVRRGWERRKASDWRTLEIRRARRAATVELLKYTAVIAAETE